MTRALVALVAFGGLVAGCASAPKTESARASLDESARVTLQDMTARDPAIRPLLDQAAGYVVFPQIGQGGFIVGGASGRGVVYQGGVPVGYAQLSQASVGAQVGGQKYAELIILRDQGALDRMRSGTFDVGGQTAAVVVRTGAASATQFGVKGIAVFVQPLGGAMLNVSLTGQRIKFSG